MPIPFATDQRIVMTLDAGGSSLKFSAVRGNQPLIDPLSLTTEAADLDRCLGNIVRGFENVKQSFPEPPVAMPGLPVVLIARRRPSVTSP